MRDLSTTKDSRIPDGPFSHDGGRLEKMTIGSPMPGDDSRDVGRVYPIVISDQSLRDPGGAKSSDFQDVFVGEFSKMHGSSAGGFVGIDQSCPDGVVHVSLMGCQFQVPDPVVCLVSVEMVQDLPIRDVSAIDEHPDCPMKKAAMTDPIAGPSETKVSSRHDLQVDGSPLTSVSDPSTPGVEDDAVFWKNPKSTDFNSGCDGVICCARHNSFIPYREE